MVYLVPGFHPTNVDNIKRNDFAVACFLSVTFGRLIRPNMARRAFERDPVFSAALAIQRAAHLRRIARLGGKAQAASGQLAAKAAAGRKAQAASGQLAAAAAAGGKAQAASGMLAAKAAAGGRAKAASRVPRWKKPSGVGKKGDAAGRYAVYFNEKYIGTYSTREAAYFVWNVTAREWNETHANPSDKYALYELSPDDTAKFESRDPRWKEPSGVRRKEKGKYAAYFNGNRIGTYSTLEAAYFVWNDAAREWNETHANPFDKYALWELSPEETAKFESRDPRWKEPSGVKKEKGKYAVNFNGNRIGTYSTLEAAYSFWNDAAREWNETHTNPFEKYALFAW